MVRSRRAPFILPIPGCSRLHGWPLFSSSTQLFSASEDSNNFLYPPEDEGVPTLTLRTPRRTFVGLGKAFMEFEGESVLIKSWAKGGRASHIFHW